MSEQPSNPRRHSGPNGDNRSDAQIIAAYEREIMISRRLRKAKVAASVAGLMLTGSAVGLTIAAKQGLSDRSVTPTHSADANAHGFLDVALLTTSTTSEHARAAATRGEAAAVRERVKDAREREAIRGKFNTLAGNTARAFGRQIAGAYKHRDHGFTYTHPGDKVTSISGFFNASTKIPGAESASYALMGTYNQDKHGDINPASPTDVDVGKFVVRDGKNVVVAAYHLSEDPEGGWSLWQTKTGANGKEVIVRSDPLNPTPTDLTVLGGFINEASQVFEDATQHRPITNNQ